MSDDDGRDQPPVSPPCRRPLPLERLVRIEVPPPSQHGIGENVMEDLVLLASVTPDGTQDPLRPSAASTG